MQKNKAPGLDGICIEFYVKFWHTISNLLVDVFNDCYKNGSLTDSQRISVMSLIFKKGNKEEIGSYRPFSLTNVDYRILTFAMSNRVQQVIGNVINND